MKKSFLKILCLSAILLLCLSGCSKKSSNEAEASSKENTVTSVSVPEIDFNVKASKQKEVNGADTFITLKDTDAEINGSGADFNGSDIVISKGGSYAVSGRLENGRIVVKAGNGEVTVILNGADIASDYSSAFLVKKASKVTLTAYDGSVNILKDALNYNYYDDYSNADEMEPDACIYSEEELVINGDGSLLVQGNCKNGITGKSVLSIEKASLAVSASSHGITGKEELLLKNTAFNVVAGQDGLRANSTADSSGSVTLSGSNGSVSSGEDGAQAESVLTVESGRYTFLSGGGSGKEPNAEISAKAIKGGKEVNIKNGDITIDSLDDALHSNGTVNILGGTINLRSGDDAVHADDDIFFKGGTLKAEYCYEGIEATNVTLSGGELWLTTSDDGINISGGDGSGEMGRPGMDQFGASKGKLVLSGSNLFIDAEGDGLDANGDIEMSGGRVIVNGPTSGGNGVLDYDGVCNISGGELIALGSADMAMAPSDTSSQNCLVFTGISGNENELLSIQSADGTEMLTYLSLKRFNWMCYSSPDLKTGETYSAYVGGSHSGKEKNGIYSDGSYSDGTKIADLTVSGTVSSNGSLNGGFMGHGQGGHNKPDRGQRPTAFPDSEQYGMPEDMPTMPEGGFGNKPSDFGGEPYLKSSESMGF